MIVRNEENSLKRTFDSVRGVVDKWCILDTGSTDNTRDVVLNYLEDDEIVGRLYEEPFVDYATNRNQALRLAAMVPNNTFVIPDDGEQGTEWALSLSADEVLCCGDKLREFLSTYQGDESAFLVEVRTPTGAFNYPRVLRVSGPWWYENEIHEIPVHQLDRDIKPSIKIPDCWIEYRPSDPERHGKRLRERDIPLLTKQLKETKDPATKGRVISLLAQTREQLAATIQDDIPSASQEAFSALGWYALLSMDASVPPETRQNAEWKYLNVAEMLGIYLPQELVPRLLHAQKSDPGNPAIAYMLARHTANIGEDGVVRGDPRAGMQMAQRAAKIARDAVTDKEKPHDPHGLLWRPHFIAAVCAKVLGHGPAMRKSAEAGVAAGGPLEGVFEQFLK